jgi:hypothetical protein
VRVSREERGMTLIGKIVHWRRSDFVNDELMLSPVRNSIDQEKNPGQKNKLKAFAESMIEKALP